jgi:hypothetical protein
MTMLYNVEAIMWKNNWINQITKLWQKIATFDIFKHKRLKYIKLFEIIML